MKNNIIFGLHPVKSLLIDSPKIIKKLFIAHESHIKLLNKIKILKNCSIPIFIVSRKWLDIKYHNYNHQGIIAEITQPTKIFSYKDLKMLLLCKSNKNLIKTHSLILIIEKVTDPRNLGAALRTADAVGIDIVIISRYNSVPINNALVQKTASCITSNISLIQVSNLLRVIYLLKKHNYSILGTSNTGKNKTNLFYNKFIFPMAILFGSEDKGLSNIILNNCDKIIYIPMFGKITSLNISVSIGVCLYEIIRQRNYLI